MSGICSVSQLLPPCDGEVTVCERNGQLISVSDPSLMEAYLEGEVLSFPSVLINADSLRRTPSVAGKSAKAAFLELNETVGERLVASWREHGVTGVLTEICSEESQDKIHPILQNICRYVLIGMRWLSGMHLTIFPHLKLSHTDLISQFGMNRDWENSSIRFLSWHRGTNKFALALRDDTIKIFYCNKSIIPILKHKLQKNIACMEWKPLLATQLAVATQTAILIWCIDPKSHSTRPSSGAVQILSYNGHAPVTSIAWCPDGDDILLAASAFSSAIVVWCTTLEKYQVIQHLTASGGISRVLWSPEGSKVMVATPTSSFRVFETGMWSNERWSNLSGHVQCACWSPSGSVLLFALYGDPHVYSVTFPDAQVDGPSLAGCSHASVVLDLQLHSSAASDDESDVETQFKRQNYIHTMVWDDTGRRVAIMFDEDDPRHNLVALFSTSNDPVFRIAPIGYIQGSTDMEPVFLTFKPNYDMGACLTICWSEGSISYFPMYMPSPMATSSSLKFQTRKVLNDVNFTTSRVGMDKPELWSSKMYDSEIDRTKSD